jgi:hypothetical protein
VSSDVIEFLRTVAARPDVLESLKVRSKADVIAAAGQFGYQFSESEFNSLIWDLEIKLAAERSEVFDATFPLWQTMWGKFYLEYLVVDLLSSLQEKRLI